MLISSSLSWPTTNWPGTTAATQYSVLQVYPVLSDPVVATVTGSATTISYDDASNTVFQIRPSSGVDPSQTYGPEVAVFVVGYYPCRAWLRQIVRQAIADRSDGTNPTLNWPDDEINGYIQQALIELNVLFPVEADTIITLAPPVITGGNQAGVRDYLLPTDYFYMRTVEYITADGKLHLYLKEKPFRGGESTATSYIGYPKLGILLSPLAGRYYPGHYEMWEQTIAGVKGEAIHLDWDPAGDGDYLRLKYLAKRPFPANDADLMNVTPEDMNLLSLRVQMSCWLRTEGNDTRLSRWRTKEDGSRRDDMPTQKMSDTVRNLYNAVVHDRKEMRVKTRRLVRV